MIQPQGVLSLVSLVDGDVSTATVASFVVALTATVSVASLVVAAVASLVVAATASVSVAGAGSGSADVDAGFAGVVAAGRVEGGLLGVVTVTVAAGAAAVVAGGSDTAVVSVAAAGGGSGLAAVSAGVVGLVVAGADVVGTLLVSPVVTRSVRVPASELSTDPPPALSLPPQPASAPAEAQTTSSARTRRARAPVFCRCAGEAGHGSITAPTVTERLDSRNERCVAHLGETSSSLTRASRRHRRYVTTSVFAGQSTSHGASWTPLRAGACIPR